jgi:hypothetical protein
MRGVARIVSVVGLVVLLDVGVSGSAERVPVPAPPKGKGDACVEPVDVMRRQHMVFLEHQRDETVRQGIRGRKHSLKGCVECHAVPDASAGGTRTVQPFCGQCHGYAAVRIDCFQCHTGQPAPTKTAGGGPR